MVILVCIIQYQTGLITFFLSVLASATAFWFEIYRDGIKLYT